MELRCIRKIMFLDIYMECDEMSLEIKNVDENGEEIKDIDWSKWIRVSVEEVFDNEGNFASMSSRCRRFTEEELKEQLLQKLAETEGADVQSALCELAEQQLEYENDVNKALCELFDLIMEVKDNG